MSPPVLSICVPTLDARSGRAERLQDSVRASCGLLEGRDYEFCVVDCRGEVRGYTRPMIQAVSMARGPWRLLVNDDVTFTPGSIEALLAAGVDDDAWCITPDASHTDGPQVFHPWCMLWSEWSWGQIGGLDPQFRHWCSDIDIARRLVDAGHPPVKVKLPDAVVHELNASSSGPVIAQMCEQDLERFRVKWGVDAEQEKYRLAALALEGWK